MATSKNPKPANEHPEKDEAIPPADLPVEAEAEAAPVVPLGPTMGRSALGVKEVIPFSWKVVGRSGDVILTLFKSIERADSEAQLARLAGEGYYTELAILENNAVVVQPKTADSGKGKKSKGKEPEKPAASEKGKTAAPAPPKKVEKPAAKPPAKPAAKAKEPDRKPAAKEKQVVKKKEPSAKKSKPAPKPNKKK